ncbi:AraC family transcriptional regulator N-terminal domain-containing protein [Caulobacter segnis]
MFASWRRRWGWALPDERRGAPLHTAVADKPLIEALGRYLALTADTQEARIIAPLIRREIYFRLLTSPIGGMLRSLLATSGHASRIAKAIQEITARYREPLALPELASFVGMSPSSFHAHFKAITGMTPLPAPKRPAADRGAACNDGRRPIGDVGRVRGRLREHQPVQPGVSA